MADSGAGACVMRTAFIETLCDLAAGDDRIWLLTGDLGYSVLERFADRFGDRYVNVGVAEQNMTGVAAGLASCGKIVLTYSIANFPTMRCLEQIRNDVCYHGLPVKVVSVGGGFSYGAQGYTHHGVEDLAVMRALPGMTVVAPGDPVETEFATRALIDMPGPGYLRLGKAGEPMMHEETPEFEIGRAIRMREGRDATLISTGGMLQHTLSTARTLDAEHGIRTRVLSMHTIKPLDTEAVEAAARETRGVVTVEEHSVTGGLGSAVADVMAAMEGPRSSLRAYGAPDQLNHRVAGQAALRTMAGDLVEVVRDLVKGTRA